MDALGIPAPLWPVVLVGGWTLAFWFAWLVYRGRLISEAQHLRETAFRDAALEAERTEKAMWREAAQTSSEQARRMLEGLETVEQLLRGLLDQKDST